VQQPDPAARSRVKHLREKHRAGLARWHGVQGKSSNMHTHQTIDHNYRTICLAQKGLSTTVNLPISSVTLQPHQIFPRRKIMTITKVFAGLALSTLMIGSASANDIALPSGTYELDPTHGSLFWTVNHFGLSNYTARINGFDATVDLNARISPSPR
jgi:hypothetical protein